MRTLALTFVGMSLMAAPAFADDPKFEFGKVEEVKAVKSVEWDASAEFGLVLTTGNSEVTTMTGGAKASRKTGKNKLTRFGILTLYLVTEMTSGFQKFF